MSGVGLGFRATVIAGVLSTLIAALISWLLGFGPGIWSWIVKVGAAFWVAVNYPVPIQLGVLMIFAGAFVYAWIWKAPSSTRSREVSEQQPRYATRVVPTGEWLPKKDEATSKPSLSANEEQVVRLLSAADGRWLGIETMSSSMQLSKLITEHAVEKLFARAFIKDRHNYIHGTDYRLTSEGRDYAIERGYVL